jgi:hypothetical protein
LVKRSAFALGFLLVWNIIEGIINGVLTFKIFPESTTATSIMQFFPLQSMSNLIVEPFSRLSVVKNLGTQIGLNDIKNYDVALSSLLIVICWTTIFVFFSYKLLKNRDL